MQENNSLFKTIQHLCHYSYSLLAIALTLFSFYLCYAIEWRGPFRDLWEFVGIIAQQFNGNWPFNELIQPYGGIHRILLPKLLFYLDFRYAAGSNLLALSVTLALHISAAGLFIYRLFDEALFKTQDRQWLVAMTLLFFFSTTQIYNLIYISDNQVVIGNSLSVFCAAVFCYYLQNKQALYLCLANLLLVLACLSHASALMMWPASIVVMCVLRDKPLMIALQIALATLLLGLYVSGYDPLDNTDITLPLWQQLANTLFSLLANVGNLLRYIGLHLSSPTSRDYPLTGIVISYLSIIYLVTITWRIYNKRWLTTTCDRFCLTLASYGVFIAIITACGRQIYPNSALTDRYQTLVMTYWAAMMILWYVDLQKLKPALTFLPPLLSLLLLLPYQYQNAEEMAWLSSRVNNAHTAATVGITEMDTIAATLSHPLLMDKKNLVAAHNDFLRDNRLGYFGDKESEYFLNKNSPAVLTGAPAVDNNCRGQLVSLETINHTDYKFIARADIDGMAVDTLLVIDAQQQIIGLARNHRKRGEFLPLALRNQQQQELRGFIHSAQELNFPLTFISKKNNTYCRLFSID